MRKTVVILLVSALQLALACGGDGSGDAVPGVRLGMTPRDVRDRFDPTKEGTWQTKVAAGPGANDDTFLEWNASSASPTSRASSARFEFHLGMLVAVRAHLRDGSGAERVDSTPKTVTLRHPLGEQGGGGTDVTLLARDCPTHHEEAEALAVRAR